MKQINNLPNSSDEFWDGEVNINPSPHWKTICSIHNEKEWLVGEYIDNRDGTVTCRVCPWGTSLPGYFHIEGNKVRELKHR